MADGKRYQGLELKGSNRFIPYLFILPSVVIIVVFRLYSVAWSFFVSFTKYPLLKSPAFNGVQNYLSLFKDFIFLKSLANTLTYMFVTVPVRMVLGFILAVLLNDNSLKGRSAFRGVFYFPQIAPIVSMSSLWMWMYNEKFGVINGLLGLLGIPNVPWLRSAAFAMPSIMIMSIWLSVGWEMLLYLGGLQGISPTYYEAARIDGVDGWKAHWYITLPLLRPIILLSAVMSTINSSMLFDQVYVMTGGGPGYSTMTLVQQVYTSAFTQYEMGYACSISMVLLAMVGFLTWIQFKVLKSE
jgi:multiple sugar transport system permease protein